MFKVSIFILLVSLVFSKARFLVPSIDAGNSGTDSGYDLFINHENGYRKENVEEVAPGELMVRGEQRQRFKNSKLFIVYEAGRNGYLANYKIETTIGKPQGEIDHRLSAKLLGSAAG